MTPTSLHIYDPYVEQLAEPGTMNKLVANAKRQGVVFSSPSPPRYVRLGSSLGVGRCNKMEGRKGYVPVMVGGGGGGGGEWERFMVPTQFVGHPSIVALLEMSAEEFGYAQEGVLQIPCHPDTFRDILNTLPFKKT